MKRKMIITPPKLILFSAVLLTKEYTNMFVEKPNNEIHLKSHYFIEKEF